MQVKFYQIGNKEIDNKDSDNAQQPNDSEKNDENNDQTNQVSKKWSQIDTIGEYLSTIVNWVCLTLDINQITGLPASWLNENEQNITLQSQIQCQKNQITNIEVTSDVLKLNKDVENSENQENLDPVKIEASKTCFSTFNKNFTYFIIDSGVTLLQTLANTKDNINFTLNHTTKTIDKKKKTESNSVLHSSETIHIPLKSLRKPGETVIQPINALGEPIFSSNNDKIKHYVPYNVTWPSDETNNKKSAKDKSNDKDENNETKTQSLVYVSMTLDKPLFAKHDKVCYKLSGFFFESSFQFAKKVVFNIMVI